MQFAVLLALAAGVVFGQGGGVSASQAYGEFRADVQKETESHIQALKVQIAAAQVKLEDLRARFTDSHPEVKAAWKSMIELEVQLAYREKQLDRYKALAEVGAVPGAPAAQAPKLVLPDRWWSNPLTVQFLGLTADQQKKMDNVIAQFRDKLKADTVELKQQERVLEPLVSANPLDEAKTTEQIDRVAEARAELEKTNGRMLLGIRKLLTGDQWGKLNQAFTLNLAQK